MTNTMIRAGMTALPGVAVLALRPPNASAQPFKNQIRMGTSAVTVVSTERIPKCCFAKSDEETPR